MMKWLSLKIMAALRLRSLSCCSIDSDRFIRATPQGRPRPLRHSAVRCSIFCSSSHLSALYRNTHDVTTGSLPCDEWMSCRARVLSGSCHLKCECNIWMSFIGDLNRGISNKECRMMKWLSLKIMAARPLRSMSCCSIDSDRFIRRTPHDRPRSLRHSAVRCSIFCSSSHLSALYRNTHDVTTGSLPDDGSWNRYPAKSAIGRRPGSYTGF